MSLNNVIKRFCNTETNESNKVNRSFTYTEIHLREFILQLIYHHKPLTTSDRISHQTPLKKSMQL